MNPADYMLAQRSNNHSSYSMFTLAPILSPYILLVSPHQVIILTPVSDNTYFFPPSLNPAAQHASFTNRGNISSSSFTPRLHASYPLRLPDRKILWAHRSFICSIIARGRDMRDLRLCTLLRYDKLSMKKKI